MRPVLVLPFAALVVGSVLSACGSQTATSTSPGTPVATPTGAATTPLDDEWVSSGPLATSMPTRTCVTEESPVQDGVSTSWMSCFDPSHYATQPPCEPPSGATDGVFLCVVTPKLTQRVVDDWNEYADEQDRASAERQGLTLEEYRRQNPDQHADGSPVVPLP